MKILQKVLVAFAVLWLLVAAGAAYPLTIDPTITDDDWISIQGLDGRVHAFAVDASGAVYVGGEFTTAGSFAVNHIAKWDGATWSALDSGLNGTVYALAIDASGAVYAGGGFTKGGDNTTVYNHIAKWDGATWSALGSGMEKTTTLWESIFGAGKKNIDCAVRALAIDAAGTVYAGGNFTEAGGVTANYIAKWDGMAWSALGLGMRKIYSRKEYNAYNREGCTVYALAIDAAGDLYAGGNFTQAGIVIARGIAKWNGWSWSALGVGLRQTYDIGWYLRFYFNVYNPTVYALTIDAGGNVYVGGGFINTGGGTAYNIAKWNGLFWSALGEGKGYHYSDTAVYALAVDAAGNLYAGGTYYLKKWDGATWSSLGSGVSGDYPHVHALAVDPAGDLYAGGYFTTAGGKVSLYIAKCLTGAEN